MLLCGLPTAGLSVWSIRPKTFRRNRKGDSVAKKKSDLFEEALKKLQDLVEKLEKGDLPLEEAMECFSEGIRTAQFCHKKLEEAETKVQ
ncbi:MAG: exodeoxyribonuclease VII small subunit, partial [Syntrophobacteraceae bacterium]